MTNGEVMTMDDDGNRSGFKRILLVTLCGLALIFLIGMAAGFIAAHVEDGGGAPSAAGYAVLASLSAAALVMVFFLVRVLRTPPGTEPATSKERLNRNVLIGCGLLGGAISLLMFFADGSGQAFSREAIDPALAIGMVIIIGVILPILSWYWHTRAIDEQEAEAYKLGALGGIYVYMIGAPCWWFLWRGGLVPEPDGRAIYFITVFTVGIIWFWRKYR